jgi:hypothetical protein
VLRRHYRHHRWRPCRGDDIGVVVRAVEEGLDAEDGKELVRRLDEHGLHMTGELRATAERLVEEAGEET